MDDLFVGRDRELELLERAFEDARSGRGQLVLIAGEPGIGKSRLADEFAGRATAEGADVAWGRCWELGGAPAYWPWTEALRPLLSTATASGPDRWSPSTQLVRIIPELASGSPSANQSAEDPDGARFHLFDAVVQLLRKASSDRPLVLVLEDLHAADEPSLVLLEFVVRAVSAMPLLAIGTYRDVELTAGHRFTAVLAELLRERATSRLMLTGLDDDDVARVIEATMGQTPSSDAAAWVRDHTYGNPLYVREVVRLLAAEGRVPQAGTPLAVPRDVRETVLRRLGQLPRACAEALAVGAVIGREFSVDLLVALRGNDVVDDLHPAVQAGLLLPGLGGSGHLRFAHAVVSEAVYDALAPALRMQIHLDLADAIERLHARDLDPHLAALARHHAAALPAGDPLKAVDAARRAGDRALSRLAYEEGVRLYASAIDAATGVGDVGELVDLLLRMGEAQARAGDTAAAKATFLDTTMVARRHALWPEFAQAALGYGGRFVWTRAADDTHLIPLLREALAVLPDDPSALRVRLLARLAGALRDEPSRRPRDELSAEAVRLAEQLGDPDLLAYALAGRFTAIWAPDTGSEMASIAAALVEAAEASGDPERTAYALGLSFMVDLLFGEAERCREHVARFHNLGQGLRQPSLRWYAETLGAALLVMEGRLEQAEAAIVSARSLGQSAQAWDSEASYRLELSIVRWAQGRLPEMEDDLEDALISSPGYRFFRCMLALLHLEQGNADRARALAAELIAGGEEALPYNNDWLGAMTILTDVVVRLEMTREASAMYDGLAPYGELIGSGGGEAVTGAVHRPLGQLADLLGRSDDAVRHLERAVEIHTRMRAELWLAHTELDLAIALRRRGTDDHRQRVPHLLDRAMHRCQTLGLVALAHRVATLQDAEPSAPADRPGGLTKRELEVASLLARGASNRAIADALVISERTAETHVQNILTKLGFSARSQVAAWATRQDLDAAT